MDMCEYSHVSCVSTVGRFIHIHPWHLGLCLEGTPMSQYNKCIHYMHTLISDVIVFYIPPDSAGRAIVAYIYAIVLASTVIL